MKTPVYSGIITNYNCTASCRHCMFASSPECKKEYISKDESLRISQLLHTAGTSSVHIGGGEPFMNFEALCSLIEALNTYGIGIDYIETNAYWCRDEDFAKCRLEKLKNLGVSSIMVSVDPYHIEYIPLEMPLRLCALLEEYGFDYFIWQQKFLKRLMQLDITKTHTRAELETLLGCEYITETAREYGLGINGRALGFAEKIYQKHPAEFFATDEKCPSLSIPHHCHIDLYGNAVPSRCTGICAKAEDYLSGSIDSTVYPVFSRLLSGGTKELYDYAKQKGFIPAKEGYPTRCALCYDMRAFLSVACPTQDISLSDFYDSMEKCVSFR